MGAIPYDLDAERNAEPSDADFLRDLAGRLRYIPIIYETDDGDIDRLLKIARSIS